MLRTKLVGCSLAVALLLTGACGDGDDGEQTAGTTPVRMTLSTGTPAVGQATYTSLPQELGYWADEGVKVTINEMNGSSAALQSVHSGQGDVTVAGTSTLMVAGAKQAALKAYYTVITRSFQMPAVPPESKIRRFRDLVGKKVGVQSLESGTVPIIKGVVDAEGGDPSKVRFVTVGLGAEALSALRTKRIDALGLWDDRYAEIENLGQKLRVLTSTHADDLGFQVALSATPDWIKEHSEAAAGFARGIAKASVFAQANPEAAVRLHWRAYPSTKPIGVDEKIALRQGVRALQARLANSGPVKGKWGLATPDQVAGFRDLLVRTGSVEKSVDTAALWTDKFINTINGFDAEKVKAQAREWKP